MSTMIDLVRTRRSIRSFTREPVSPEHRALLTETLLRSPSSRGLNPWEFVLVDDLQLLEQLARAKQHGSAFLKDAPLGIVICGDPQRCDVWIEDCSIAAILLQMSAHSLGLGSCWIQIRERTHDSRMTSEEYIRRVLVIPDHLRVASVIAVGYPAIVREPLAADQLQYDKLMYNRYGEPLRPD